MIPWDADLAAINNDPVQLYLRRWGASVCSLEMRNCRSPINWGGTTLSSDLCAFNFGLENESNEKAEEGHVRAKNLIAGLDEDDNVIEDDERASKKLRMYWRR